MNDTQELNEFLNRLHESDGYYMKNEINLIELQNKIHAQNKDLGWWDEPRGYDTFTNLFHSEVSEVMEGDRKQLMDDHLPKYEMVVVEAADCIIRCLDYLGSIENKSYICTIESCDIESKDVQYLMAYTHYTISHAWYYMTLNKNDTLARVCLRDAVRLCSEVISRYGYNKYQIILEKVEYNKHRADHKKENREKPGGKKY